MTTELKPCPFCKNIYIYLLSNKIGRRVERYIICEKGE